MLNYFDKKKLSTLSWEVVKELGNYFEWGGCLLGLRCDDKLKCVVQSIVSVSKPKQKCQITCCRLHLLLENKVVK
jgi:hypothetical protein